MSRRSTLLWLYLAVLGPLGILALLAWWGTESRLKGEWEDTRKEAAVLAEERAEQLAAGLEAKVVIAVDYPNPPVPGERSALDDILDGNDSAELLALRENPKAGISPAGLPRRTLAALRLLAVDPEAQDTEDIRRIIITEAPSVITLRALEQLEGEAKSAVEFTRAEEARKLAKELPGEGTAEAWSVFDQEEIQPWWIQREAGEVRFVAPSDIRTLIESTRANLPKWARIQIGVPEAKLNELPALPKVAGAIVPFGEGMTLSIMAVPSILEADIRAQQLWTLALLAVAVATAALSLAMIHRTILRERRLAEMKTQFVSSVSHELRAPLGSIRLMAEALEHGKTKQPAEFHKLIAREGARLSHLIENVLDFARIEDGRKQYHFEECEIEALLENCIRLMSPLAAEKDLMLESRLTEVVAHIDPGAIEQAVINLLDNAIKFSPAGGTIRISCRWRDQPCAADPKQWELVIADEGPGVPPEERERIFERFHRLGDELRRETQGTGIGLSIVKHIAEAHDGRTTVSGTPPEGATFKLILPEEPCAS